MGTVTSGNRFLCRLWTAEGAVDVHVHAVYDSDAVSDKTAIDALCMALEELERLWVKAQSRSGMTLLNIKSSV